MTVDSWVTITVGLAGILVVLVGGLLVFYARLAVVADRVKRIGENDLPHLQRKIDGVKKAVDVLSREANGRPCEDHDRRLERLEEG